MIEPWATKTISPTECVHPDLHIQVPGTTPQTIQRLVDVGRINNKTLQTDNIARADATITKTARYGII